ncbi:hypothetical protein D770_08245 [Flammeovirgaceae bacterium 311]|nr:hypothetical protein D770_08245 [Flammeovirgaceae bacterium 311]
MYIQIDKAGFVNKGAELMLFSIMDRLGKEKNLNPIFVAGRGIGRAESIRKAGLFQKVNLQRLNIPFEKLFDQYRFEQYGLIKENKINAVLDAGGFQFGDQWEYLYSTENNLELKRYYKKLKNHGAKIVFMPQAFGPFNKPLSLQRIKIVFEYADKIYARDRISYKYLEEVFGENQKISISPDFTNLLKPDISLSNYLLAKDAICIIPNSKMLTHTPDEIKTKYIPFLIALISHYLANGEKIILLNHEGSDDFAIINEIKNKTNVELPVLNGLNALEIKACIKHFKLLISSRYHGVASGLNQGVQTYCTSWSHKYKELMDLYGIKNGILDVNTSFEKALAQLNNYEVNGKLEDNIAIVEVTVDRMWKDIITNII